MKDKIYAEIVQYAKEIRMPSTVRCFEDEIREAEVKSKTYADFLHGLLQKEYDLRKENGKKNRIRVAGFPAKKYLEDMAVKDLPEDARKKLRMVEKTELIINK